MIECKTCGHIFEDEKLEEGLAKGSRIAKARMKAFHWYHKVSHKTCTCCGCKAKKYK